MDNESKLYRAHCLVVPFPYQGHINPMFQFSKRLRHKGLKVTSVTTRFIYNTLKNTSSSNSIKLETISDGFDDGGMKQAPNRKTYLDSLSRVGSQTLSELIEKMGGIGHPVNCIVYDAFMPWCLDVAKSFGIVGAVFFTQSCAVGSLYYHVYKGVIELPIKESEISVPGLPPLQPQDLPSFMYKFGSYPGSLDMLGAQFSNIDQADLVLCNTFYELEKEVVNWMAMLWPVKTIGPTLPSMYLDKQIKDDIDYDFSIFKANGDNYLNWLKEKPEGSVAYISFGSMAAVCDEQMKELCYGLKRSNSFFLWVVRESEKEKLPKTFIEDTKEKGLVLSWCTQLDVLSNAAIGCFITHCGWNSILEALSLGAPMVAMPQWTDQTTNAKFVVDIWKIGVKASSDEKGIVRSETIKSCIKEVMEGEKGKEIKRNTHNWKIFTNQSMATGGSSDRNINEFIASLC